MLTIHIEDQELWDEANECFVPLKGRTLQLEHSLVSISKWEAKWHKRFMDSEKSPEEMLDYIRCMTLTQNVPDYVYNYLPSKNIDEIVAYIKNPMTATDFPQKPGGRKATSSSEAISSELIYYWMTVFNIPSEYQKWHINRLLTLIKICEVKSEEPKKMSRSELAKQNTALNAARRNAHKR